jgi:hypothetical protein
MGLVVSDDISQSCAKATGQIPRSSVVWLGGLDRALGVPRAKHEQVRHLAASKTPHASSSMAVLRVADEGEVHEVAAPVSRGLTNLREDLDPQNRLSLTRSASSLPFAKRFLHRRMQPEFGRVVFSVIAH